MKVFLFGLVPFLMMLVMFIGYLITGLELRRIICGF